MRSSNIDIVEFYKKDKSYAKRNIKTIQFDTYEIEFINNLLDNFAYSEEYFLDKNEPICIRLIIDCIDAIDQYMDYFNNFICYPVGYFKKTKQDIDKDLLKNFLKLNSEVMLIDINTKFNGNYIWFEENIIGDKVHYSGFFSFSRVGFNSDKTKAMMVFEYNYAPLCGSGDILVFEKIDGNWEIINSMELWIS